MLLDVIICAAIAWLLLMLLWCLAGRLLLPVRPDARTVYRLTAEEPALERQVRAANWLRSAGLFDGTLVLVTGDAPEAVRALAEALARRYPFVECCDTEE